MTTQHLLARAPAVDGSSRAHAAIWIAPARAQLAAGAALLLAGCGSDLFIEPDAAAGSDGAGQGGAGVAGATAGAGATAAGGSGGACVASTEVCDGIDNDCNGAVDEWDPAFDDPCETRLLGACAAGHVACADGKLACAATVPVAETCNGVDDDCDGATDEDISGVGLSCDTGNPGVCGLGELACTAGELVCVPHQRPSADVCDLLDNDCDGTADNGVSCLRRVFVTSSLFSGDLGGLDGADAKCQAAAEGAGLSGVYRAWLSHGSEWAAQRQNHVGAPYVLIDGTVVAADWAELTSGQLQHAIDTSEIGGPALVGQGPTQGQDQNTCAPDLALVWSNTGTDGTTAPQGYQCFGWTTAQTGLGASYGIATAANASWTLGCSAIVGACSASAALYCVEQ